MPGLLEELELRSGFFFVADILVRMAFDRCFPEGSVDGFLGNSLVSRNDILRRCYRRMVKSYGSVIVWNFRYGIDDGHPACVGVARYDTMDAMVRHDCIAWFFAHDRLSSQQVFVGCRGRKRRLREIFVSGGWCRGC